MFRLILGLEKPDSGVILFGTSAGDTGNNDIKASSGMVSKSDPCRIRGMRPLISAVFQENRLLEGYTAIENLRFALGKRYSSEALTAYLLRLLPEDALNKPVCEFSGGMKRRVTILRAILAPSEIILMDEPFTGLDADTRQLTIDMVKELCAGKLLIAATHSEDDAELLGRRSFTYKPENHFNWLLTSQPYHPICQSLTTIYEKECASRDRLRQSTSSRECASLARQCLFM